MFVDWCFSWKLRHKIWKLQTWDSSACTSSLLWRDIELPKIRKRFWKCFISLFAVSKKQGLQLAKHSRTRKSFRVLRISLDHYFHFIEPVYGQRGVRMVFTVKDLLGCVSHDLRAVRYHVKKTSENGCMLFVDEKVNVFSLLDLFSRYKKRYWYMRV